MDSFTGYTFNPKDASVSAGNQTKMLNPKLDIDLDDIIKQKGAKRKAERESLKASTKPQRGRDNKKTDKKSQKPVDKKGKTIVKKTDNNKSKKPTPKPGKQSNVHEIKIAPIVLKSILNEVGIDTEKYDLKLVAMPKK